MLLIISLGGQTQLLGHVRLLTILLKILSDAKGCRPADGGQAQGSLLRIFPTSFCLTLARVGVFATFARVGGGVFRPPL